MPDFLKPYISRVIAGLVASLAGWLVTKHITLDGDTQQQLIAAMIGIASAMFAVIYALLHKWIDKLVNPTDGAAQANIAHGMSIKAKADALAGN